MSAYRHRQFSIPAAITLAALPLLLLWFWIRDPQSAPFMLVALLFVAVILFLFSSLTVEVSDREMTWAFGPGFWRNRIALSDIAKVETTSLPWWYGSGIKWNRDGWMYLVSMGGDAVSIQLKDGSTIRIGTNDPQGLSAALAPGKVSPK
jgi:hypothetical protein